MSPQAEKNSSMPIQANRAYLYIGVLASKSPDAISSEALSFGSFDKERKEMFQVGRRPRSDI